MPTHTKKTRQPEPRFVPLADAARYASAPVSTMRDWIRRGLLPAYRIGPRLLQIDLNDTDRMRRRVPAVGADPDIIKSQQPRRPAHRRATS
jgi:hypothetical protein